MRKILLLLGILSSLMGGVALITPAYAVENNVTVKAVPGASLQEMVTSRARESWSWYVIRASGIVAGITLIILLLSGVGSVTGHTFRFLDPLTAWATHRALGITFVVTVLVHMFALLFDKFVPFSVPELLVPWLSDYQSTSLLGVAVGSLYVALGILAFYGSIVVLITSLKWVDKKPKLWKATHIISYAIMAAVFVHALFMGTDTGTGIGRVLWVVGGVLVLMAIVARLRRTGVL